MSELPFVVKFMWCHRVCSKVKRL